MTRTVRTAFVVVATLCMFALSRRADACSCWKHSECPTGLRKNELVFVATAHVQPIVAAPAIATSIEEPTVTWHDDFRLSVNMTVVGQLPSTAYDPKPERTTLVVERRVRGIVRGQYQFVGQSFGMSCDYQFRDGEQYLVYGDPVADGSISPSICSLTKPLRMATADLALLAGEGVEGLSGTVRGTLRFYDDKRLADAIKVVLERPDGERLFEINKNRFAYFEMYPVPPGAYVLSVMLNESDKALKSRPILVAPGQCRRDRIDLTVGTYEDWVRRAGPWRSVY